MFKDLFDFTYERNFEESAFFYFFYVLFGYYFTGLVYSILKICFVPTVLCYAAVLFAPSVFYSYIAISIYNKKKLADDTGFAIMMSTVITGLVMTLFNLPACFVIGIIFPQALTVPVMLSIFIELVICCVPVTMLTTREDLSLKYEVRLMDRERLFKERFIEKQLLKERILAKSVK